MNDARKDAQRDAYEHVTSAARTLNNAIAVAALTGVEITIGRKTRPAVGDLPPCPQVIVEPFKAGSAS